MTPKNMVAVLGDAWQHRGVVWWEYKGTRGGTGVSLGPSNNLEGVTGPPLAPPTN